MVAKSGDRLVPDAALEALRHRLIPCVFLLTPNLPEAAALLSRHGGARNVDEMAVQGHALRFLGANAVPMKGGDLSGSICRDVLIDSDGGCNELKSERVATKNTHGTGCSLPSAVAAELAKGKPLDKAVANAHGYLQGAIAASDKLKIDTGHGSVHHFYR